MFEEKPVLESLLSKLSMNACCAFGQASVAYHSKSDIVGVGCLISFSMSVIVYKKRK